MQVSFNELYSTALFPQPAKITLANVLRSRKSWPDVKCTADHLVLTQLTDWLGGAPLHLAILRLEYKYVFIDLKFSTQF